jgi:hypothetical protein
MNQFPQYNPNFQNLGYSQQPLIYQQPVIYQNPYETEMVGTAILLGMTPKQRSLAIGLGVGLPLLFLVIILAVLFGTGVLKTSSEEETKNK